MNETLKLRGAYWTYWLVFLLTPIACLAVLAWRFRLGDAVVPLGSITIVSAVGNPAAEGWYRWWITRVWRARGQDARLQPSSPSRRANAAYWSYYFAFEVTPIAVIAWIGTAMEWPMFIQAAGSIAITIIVLGPPGETWWRIWRERVWRLPTPSVVTFHDYEIRGKRRRRDP